MDNEEKEYFTREIDKNEDFDYEEEDENGKGKRILLLVVVLLIIAGLSFGAYKFFLQPEEEPFTPIVSPKIKITKRIKPKPKPSPLVSKPSLPATPTVAPLKPEKIAKKPETTPIEKKVEKPKPETKLSQKASPEVKKEAPLVAKVKGPLPLPKKEAKPKTKVAKKTTTVEKLAKKETKEKKVLKKPKVTSIKKSEKKKVTLKKPVKKPIKTSAPTPKAIYDEGGPYSVQIGFYRYKRSLISDKRKLDKLGIPSFYTKVTKKIGPRIIVGEWGYKLAKKIKRDYIKRGYPAHLVKGSNGKYLCVLGPFPNIKRRDEVLDKILDDGYMIELVDEGGAETFYKLRVGKFKTKKKAKEVLAMLKKKGFKPIIVRIK